MDEATLKDLSGPSRLRRSERLELISKTNVIDKQIIDILIAIDNVPCTISDYRDRERHLEELLVAIQLEDKSRIQTTHEIVFEYLLGSLYINFEKFWGPTFRAIYEVIKSSLIQAQLLTRLVEHLKNVNDVIYGEAGSYLVCSPEDRPDHVLHRNFIYQLIARFPQCVIAQDRIFMNEFFRFVDRELQVSPFIEKLARENLRVDRNQPDDTEIDNSTANNHESTQKPTRRSKKAKPISETTIQKRKSRETFITATKIFQALPSIEKLHRSDRLHDFLMDLLCCRDSGVQKTAFNCLLHYNHVELQPYVNQLSKIINDKMVRTELNSFVVDQEKSKIQPEHRDFVMQVLMRILFGKMIGKVGKKSGGRDKSDARKTLIMRFVANCETKEICYFFGILFDPIYDSIKTPYKIIDKLSLDVESYVPLNKLQAMLASLKVFIQAVGHFKADVQPVMLKLMALIIYHVVKPLSQDGLCAKSIDTLKTLRRLCLNIIRDFMQTFEYYSYSQDEIDFVFNNLIWPSTESFVDRNHAVVTPMFRLIETIASNRIYHPLLIKRNCNDKERYLLRLLIDLYQDAKTKRNILKAIATLFANIINPERDCDENELAGEVDQPIIKDKDAICPVYDTQLYNISQEVTLGQSMLLPYIGAILNRLKQSCKQCIDNKSSDFKIHHDELFILSELSAFIKDSEQSVTCSRLLLQTINQQSGGDSISITLRTVKNLIKQIESEPDTGIMDLCAEFLCNFRHFKQRQEVCEVIATLAEKHNKLEKISAAIASMNSLYDDMMGAPDLVAWNEGFRVAIEYIESIDREDLEQPDAERNQLCILISQVGFILNNVDRYEFSIRDNCQLFFDKLSAKFEMPNVNPKLFRELIEDIVVQKLVKKGLRSTNEAVKNAYIGVLRNLALHCHEKSQTLKELRTFCDYNEDIDFWLNIKHIQYHNRSRALARLVADERLNQLSSKTLSSFIMPIASGFMFNKNYRSLASLTENSIRIIGLICKRLNWVTYESTISYYLDLLTKSSATYQRTNIKLITEILRNFNFDLSACPEAIEHAEEDAKLAQRMRRRRGKEGTAAAIATSNLNGKKLNPSTAKLVYHSVINKLIPRLQSCLHEMTRVEFEHDKNMSNYLPETEEIKRIPIAFAIVQLLNLLPCKHVLLRDHLPGLFLKLVSFLKSKNELIRKTSRATTIKIMNFLGPAYMPDLLRILKQNLDKGFHIHVLNYTIHSVILKLPLAHGDLDGCAKELVDTSINEIFGKPSESKEIAQVLAKTMEAKKTKSYDTLLLLATYVGHEALEIIMGAIYTKLRESNDPKLVNKVSLCIQKVFTGLSKNDGFPVMKMLDFIKTAIGNATPHLKVRQTEEVAADPAKNSNTKSTLPLREDRYLIKKDFTRRRIQSRINERGNYHMLVENSLRLLLHIFQRNKKKFKLKKEYQTQLEPFMDLLSDCLKSNSPKSVMRALKCIHFLVKAKADVSTMKSKCKSVVRKIFILLDTYNGVGMVQGDNLEMIRMCFRAITLLLLRCPHVELDKNQIRALLTYVEQDLNDPNRQTTAFAALNSLLRRKCQTPELEGIMLRVADLLITSDDDKVRSMSNRAWQIYLIDYSHEPATLHAHLSRFLRQLDYEHIDGRRSVLAILNVVICKFPDSLLVEYNELMFHLLSQRLVNEESGDLCDCVAKTLSVFIQRLSSQQVNMYNRFVAKWSTSDNPSILLLGIKLTAIFVDSCTKLFSNKTDRLKSMLECIARALALAHKTTDPEVESANGLTVDRVQDENSNDIESEAVVCYKGGVTVEDKLAHNTAQLFKMILDKELINYTENRFIKQLGEIWLDLGTRKLVCAHIPTVLSSCELYLNFLQKVDLERVMTGNTKLDEQSFLNKNAKQIVRNLCDAFITLLDRVGESDLLLGYITNGLILLGKLLAKNKSTLEFEREYTKQFDKGNIVQYLCDAQKLPDDGFVHEKLPCSLTESRRKLNLAWLSLKIVMQARKEAALYRLSTMHRRQLVLVWSAAIAEELGPSRIGPYALLFMMTPVRELTDKGKSKMSERTVSLSEDLLKFFKALIGVEAFNKLHPKVQLHFAKRRIGRKQQAAILKVKDQARGVKRKLDKQRDKEAKSKANRQMRRDVMKGKVVQKKVKIT